MQQQAIIYGRWSSLEQGSGSTLERQLSDCDAFCRNNNFTVVGRYFDEGRSAYTGDNLRTGELSKITREVLCGTFPANTVLVVEQLDRLSRLPPLDVLEWITSVIKAGLTIRTANDGAIINQQEYLCNPTALMMLVLNAFRAHGESASKSDRVSKAWTIKRAKAAKGEGGKFTSICPAWLRLNKGTGEFDLIDERVSVVRSIFAMAEEGHGKLRIAKMLNTTGVAPWGRGKSQGKAWGASYIQKITQNPAVLGDFQPCRKARADTKRTPVGDVLKGYFPAIIDEAQFARVNDRKAAQDRRAGRKGELKNILSGIATCAACSGRMRYINKGSAGTARNSRNGSRVPIVVVRRRDESYLVCDNASRGVCNNSIRVGYLALETALLEAVLHLAVNSSDLQDETALTRLEIELAAGRRERDAAKVKTARMLSLFKETGYDDVKAEWLATKVANAEIAAHVEALEGQMLAARGELPMAEHMRRVNSVRAAIYDCDLDTRVSARIRIMGALRAIITKAAAANGAFTVTLANGLYRLTFANGNVVDETGMGVELAALLSDETAASAAKVETYLAAVISEPLLINRAWEVLRRQQKHVPSPAQQKRGANARAQAADHEAYMRSFEVPADRAEAFEEWQRAGRPKIVA